MAENQHERTKMLVGETALERIQRTRVAIFGVGGVGGYVAEALARAGIGEIHLIDHDTVSVTNINRQIIALHSTVGRYKVDVMRDRIADINPEARVFTYPVFFEEETKREFDFASFDYVVDAIDSLSAKIELIATAKAAGAKIISAMGAGNKLDPTAFKLTDISKTKVCPLARAVRTRLKKRGIYHLDVVYSEELSSTTETVECTQNCDTSPDVSATTPYQASKTIDPTDTTPNQMEMTPTSAEKTPTRRAPASISFVPSAMGLVIAGAVVRNIIKAEK